MKCHLCVNYIEMQTDPATCDYLIVSGAQRKEERWDMAENEQILTTGNEFVWVTEKWLWTLCLLKVDVITQRCCFVLPPDFLFVYLFSASSPERMEKEKLETDAMYKLDHSGKDKAKLTKALPSLSEIQDYQSGWKDDFQLNCALRRKFRVRS